MKPSLTTLISLLDKPALLKWANKIGLQGISIDDYRKKSTNDGTKFHNQIERFLSDGIPFDNESDFQKYNNLFRNFNIIDFEKSFECEYFCGRYDIKFSFNNLVYIGDFKSNQQGLYFENKLQLAGYRMATGCDKVTIISIPDFTFIPVKIDDYAPYENILKSLSNIYYQKSKLGLY